VALVVILSAVIRGWRRDLVPADGAVSTQQAEAG
jgi:hypothetical protein